MNIALLSIATFIVAILISYKKFFYVLYFTLLIFAFLSKSKLSKNNLLQYISKIALLIIITISIAIRFLKNQFIENETLNFLIANEMHIALIGLLLLVIMAFDKEVSKAITQEQKSENLALKQKSAHFEKNFPTLNAIPLIGYLSRSIYSNGFAYSFVVILLLIVGFYIRLYKLGELSFWWDEFFTSQNVKNIIDYGLPKSPDETEVYWRGVAYHYLVYIFAKIFAFNEFFLRLPSVFFGMGIVFITFIFGKKINKFTALCILIFMVFSTYNIEYSRFARFYLMNAFLFLVEIIFVYKGFFQNKTKYKILSLVTGFIMIHVVQLGQFFLFVIFAYFICDLIRSKKINRFINKNKTNFIYAIAGGAIVLVNNIFIRFFQSSTAIYLYQINTEILGRRKWDYLQFPDAKVLEFFNSSHILIIFCFFAITVFFLTKKNNFLKFLFTIFIVITLAYGILNRGVYGSRIFLMWESLYVIVSFLGILYLLKIFKVKKVFENTALLIITIILIISIKPYFYERINIKYGENVINDSFRTSNVATYRSDEKNTYEHLAQNIKKNDIWISVMAESSIWIDRYPDYLINQNARWNTRAVRTDEKGNFYNKFNSILINKAEEIENIIKNNPDKKIWLTIKGSSMNVMGTTHIRNDLRIFIDKHQDKIQYRSDDYESFVLLFD